MSSNINDFVDRGWLTTNMLLEKLPRDLRDAAWAVAIPHWFDANTLAALLPSLRDRAESLYLELKDLPFVESFGATENSNIHQLTREAMLKRWWKEKRDEYVELSGRAADYFAQHQDEPAWQIERIYHLLINDPNIAANELKNLGHEWNSYFQYTLVYALAQVCLEHVHKNPTLNRVDGPAKGWIYFWQGQVDLDYNHYKEAREVFEKALDSLVQKDRVPDNDGNSHLKAHCLKALGDAYVKLGEFESAQEKYRDALELYRSIRAMKDENEVMEGEAHCLLAMGHSYLNVAKYKAAQEQYTNALHIYPELGNKKTGEIGKAHCLKSLGDAQRELYDLPKALDNLNKAFNIYQTIGAQLWTADCRKSIAGVYMRQQEYKKAQKEYVEVLRTYEELENKQGMADCHKSLGDAKRRLRNAKAAYPYYEKALRLYKDINSKRSEADCLKSLGDMYKDMAEYPAAQKWYNEALSLYQELGIKLDEANCLKDLADTFVEQKKKNYKLGQEGYESALAIYRGIEGAKEQTANCLKAMGKLFLVLEDSEAARQKYAEALSLYQEIGKKEQADECAEALERITNKGVSA